MREAQPVKLKLAAFTFQKYGMLEGTVGHVSADAAEIHLGTRTVLEYLLSPVQKAYDEAARER